MRLKHIYITVKRNIGTINNMTRNATNAANSTTTLSSWNGVAESLEVLRNVDALHDEVEAIIALTPFIMEKKSSITIPRDKYDRLVSLKHSLHSKMAAIIDLCESMGMDEVEYGFDVKLPPAKDFNQFAKNIADFNQFIKMCPVFQEEDAAITVVGSDVGSTWIIFAVLGGAAAISIVLNNFAKVAESAVKIRSMWISCDQQKEFLRSAQDKNALLEKITECYGETVKAVAESCAKEIQESREKDDPEQLSKMQKSIELLGDLFHRGMEIYASIEAPAEVKAVFPPVEEMALPEEVLKMLAQGKSE